MFKEGIHNAKDPIDLNSLKTKLSNNLARNSGYIYKYHVAPDSITTEKIIDKCQINKNDCEYSCTFDYTTTEFKCLCAEGMQLSSDGKTCVEPQPEPHIPEEPDYMHVHFHDHNAYPSPEPEPITEAAKEEPKPEPVPVTEPIAQPEPQPEPSPVTEHDVLAQPEPVPVTEQEIVPQPAFVTEKEVVPQPEPEPVTEQEPVPEPASAPVTEQQQIPHPEPIPSTENVPQPEPTVEAQPEPAPEPEPTPEPEPEVNSSAPEHRIILEPASSTEVEPLVEQKTESVHIGEGRSNDESAFAPEPALIPNTGPITTESAEPSTELITSEEPKISETPKENKTEETLTLSEVEPLTERVAMENIQTTMKIHTTHENMIQFPSEQPKDGTTENLNVEPITEQIFENVSHEEPAEDTTEEKSGTEMTTISGDVLIHNTSNEAVEKPVISETNTTGVSEVITTAQPQNVSEENGTMLTSHEITTLKTLIQTTMMPIASVSTGEAQITTEQPSDVTTTKDDEEWIAVVGKTELGMVEASSTESNENEISHGSSSVSQLHNESITITENKNVTVDGTPVLIPNTTVFTPLANKTGEQTTTKAPEHVAAETETTIFDNMSPFLPETENNHTLIHLLHSDINHYPDHTIIHNETGNEEPVATSPPRLDNDEMNTTNPQDPTPKDTTDVPAVLPLEEDSTARSNEIPNGTQEGKTVLTSTETTQKNLENVTSTTEKENEIKSDNDDLVISPNQLTTTSKTEDLNLKIFPDELTTLPVTSEKTVDVVKNTEIFPEQITIIPQVPESNTEIVPVENATKINDNATNEVEITTSSPIQQNANNSTNTEETIKSPEIPISTNPNIHISEITTLPSLDKQNDSSVNITVSELPSQPQDVSSSTEDLIALETTTNRLMKSLNNTDPQEISVIADDKPPTTIHAEIIETVTHKVNVVTLQPVETITMVQNKTEATTEALIKPVVLNSTSAVEGENDINNSNLPRTEPETSSKASEEISTEGLSVIPLPEHEVNDTKQDKKRVVDENDYNRLDATDLLTQEKEKLLEATKLSETTENAVSSTSTESMDKVNIKENLFTDTYLLSNNEQKPLFDKYDKKSHKKEYYDKKNKLDKFIAEEQKSDETTQKNDETTIKLIAESTTAPPMIESSKCQAEQFQCTNGTSVKDGSYCIEKDARCDSVNDCSDDSDEMGCEENKCVGNFQVCSLTMFSRK